MKTFAVIENDLVVNKIIAESKELAEKTEERRPLSGSRSCS